jgi:hypothetical protein
MTGLKMAMQEQDKTVAKQEKHEGEIAKLVDEIRNYRSEIEQLSNLVNLARENLEELLLDRGSAWKDDDGYAMLVSEGERTSYDTKALDELLVSDPLRYGWLHEYRRKTSVSPSIKIR